jgi:phosphohistidine swiveling domain-containing protein/glycerol-3-phosphate acyltransferase PlsY
MNALTDVWGGLAIFILCPILGGLPLAEWVTYLISGRRLSKIGTGNIGVSAAFYHGGRWAGIAAVLTEAGKGIAAVLLARLFFPVSSVWELVALIAIVMGRYWFAKGAGTTNAVWGFVVHAPVVAGLVCLIGGISFTILRERRSARLAIMVLMPLIMALVHPQASDRVLATAALAFLLGWIYSKIPDDLDLAPQSAQASSQPMFRFFRGDRGIPTLEQSLDPAKFGQKAARLATLRRSGYPVPMGWLLAAGDDPTALVNLAKPSPQQPFVVRSSAVDEDTETASAAGQYLSVLNVASQDALLSAINRCFESYQRVGAIQYRQDLGLSDRPMAILVQPQIAGVFSGVAFSRDPILRQGDEVLVEALPGGAEQVVSGRVTPDAYRVAISASSLQSPSSNWQLPQNTALPIEGNGQTPEWLIQQVAYLARQIETFYHGVPQDIEWSYDGEQVWLLQARPITTLVPIWTRKIAAEVIPGLIRPLTWSINRPLTCGVWGDLFTLVLGKRAQNLDFLQTATLHYSRAYFNASLLGQTFRRMGLPPESLEFLTQGAKFSRPPLAVTLRNLPGLMRLWNCDRTLLHDFQQDDRQSFQPSLTEFAYRPAAELSVDSLFARVDTILALLKPATYYSILAPLGVALRKSLAKVDEAQLDNGATPEVAALRSLQDLALAARRLLEQQAEFAVLNGKPDFKALFSALAQSSDGQAVLTRLDQLVNYYGYLSEVGTDIAIATWQEAPQPVHALFAQFCIQPPLAASVSRPTAGSLGRLQRRVDVKGRVTEVYSRLLAELRGCFLALEQQWLETGLLKESGDIFWLELTEIRALVKQDKPAWLTETIAQRKATLGRDRESEAVPFLVYGNDPPTPVFSTLAAVQQLQGIGASSGQLEGRVQIVRSLDGLPAIDKTTIVVVPYTDSGWAPLLAKAGGLIAEVGGRLSHGAIVAREYRIPAVMNIPNATQLLQNGQPVRIDGQQGTVEILTDS